MGKPILTTTAMSSYGRTARMALEEKGVSYEVDLVDFSALGSEAYLHIHPFSKVPAFYHDDFHLYETEAITRYVDEAFDGPSLQPKDAAGRARMTKWINVSCNYAYPVMISELVWQRLVIPMQGGAADEGIVAASVPETTRQLRIIDEGLGEDSFLAGDTLSLADLFLGPIVYYVGVTQEGRSVLDNLPRANAWLTRVTERPSWTATS